MTDVHGKAPFLLVTGSDASLRSLLDRHAGSGVSTLSIAELERADKANYGTNFLTAVLRCESDLVDAHPDRPVARYYPIGGLEGRELNQLGATKTPIAGTIDPRNYFVSARF